MGYVVDLVKVPTELKTKNLLLIIGTNPLPNYVAGRILALPDTRYHFVVSYEIEKTDIHKRLIKLLKGETDYEKLFAIERDFIQSKITVDSTNPDDIITKISDRVSKTSGSWGLHYTGGKKIIAIHAYLALRAALKDKQEKGHYSYLDADTLSIIFDPYDSMSTRYFNTQLPEPIYLWQLFYLHGKDEKTVVALFWNDKNQYPEDAFINRPLGKKIQRVPFKPMVCEALKNAWLTDESSEEMETWYRRELRFTSRRYLEELYEQPPSSPELTREKASQALIASEFYDPAGEYSKSKAEKVAKKQRKKIWADVRIPKFIDGDIGGKTIRELSLEWNQKIDHISDWLDGPWLEHYVLFQILKIAPQCQINDYVLGFESTIWNTDKPNEKEYRVFESDILVMQGHRLYYISVTTDNKNSICKKKLFEAYIRAQQLGGEQAEAAIVSFHPNSKRLEDELLDERHVHVKAFGRDDLKDTKFFISTLEQWFTKSA